MIFGDNQFMSKHTFHIQNLQYTCLNYSYYTWSYVLKDKYEIWLNTTNYPIFNMQDFRYWLCTSILDCFGQVVSPLLEVLVQTIGLLYKCQGILCVGQVVRADVREHCMWNRLWGQMLGTLCVGQVVKADVREHCVWDRLWGQMLGNIVCGTGCEGRC